MITDDTKIKRAVVTIKIIGVGGGGNSVIERIAEGNELDVELIAINTDAKQLAYMEEAGVKALAIGRELTKGLGTGGVADLGEAAAKGDEAKIKEVLKGADLVFVTASMGGGAGTGAAPVVAKIAKDMGILTVGVVTVPFSFEGARKKRIANEGIAKMQGNLDALIVVHNDNLMKLPENKHMTLVNAFKAADDVLRQAINCIAELILTTGEINVDFADLTSTFRQSQSGDALLGIGESQRSAIEAVQKAVESPLVEKSLTGARGLILNLSGSERMTLDDVGEATNYIRENTHPDVNIILGTVIDSSMGQTIRATIIATDFVDGVVMKAQRMEAPESKLKTESIASLEPPSFMKQPTEKVPAFASRSDFTLPKFDPFHPKK
ncbi:cell division protein FtsZ [Selenomonas sputigena]|uniref:Cell division protein FtsZ n=1 Tax=Selenomonas sputigena (strain ATCC 35185 / DSM 20758 / CCUG 44933 / VPI D19B-28) TaxID=546271 RepID=C9LT14_SELS3|nr:cell division protein FtsZ [Selenomonas sputigena]AEC00544.1 cell division protein FtsZ [Selenomonas sputigena ATCC 35185]EEX77860.1 cell division protein FtsZ [Selenomonas sputigena ATCC 35185]